MPKEADRQCQADTRENKVILNTAETKEDLEILNVVTATDGKQISNKLFYLTKQ